MALTDKNHQIIKDHFANKDTSTMYAVDATCGNGHDTLFLAKLGFNQVYAFDVQQQAIDNTRQRIKSANFGNVSLIQAGHETMGENITQNIDCIMFNLGYLPSADKNITTTIKTTLIALTQSLSILNHRGLLSIICYPGHAEGAIETKAVQGWLKTIDSTTWQSQQILPSHPNPKAPMLYLVAAD